MLRDYLFKTVRKFSQENMHTKNLNVVTKMFGVLVDCIREFENIFPSFT